MTKKCSKCKMLLSYEKFSKNSNKKDGLQSICKTCTKKYKDNHYRRNKAHYIEKNKELKKRNKKWLQNYKSKLECHRCGFNEDPIALDFHHKDPKTKKFNISEMSCYSLTKIKKEIEKCDIVCANCHRILHK